MAQIEGFRVVNYRVLRAVTLGRVWDTPDAAPLTPLATVIGSNGSGKSTLFDAFGFLADCLNRGVEEACDMRGRGGFDRLMSAGFDGGIYFQLYYRQRPGDEPITYELVIAKDNGGRPYVRMEWLRQRRRGQANGEPFSFLVLLNGEGHVWAGDSGLSSTLLRPAGGIAGLGIEESDGSSAVTLTDNRMLGIATLGVLREHPRIAAFRTFLQEWYLSYFSPKAARNLPHAGPQKHLTADADNIGNVVQYMEREHRAKFQSILDRIAAKIPGIQTIDTKRTEDGRLLLRFNNQGFIDPFYAQQMSDGTLKLFAYYLLLEDPEPPPFICIEEPENGLYPKLLPDLARDFREHAEAGGNAPQIFVTTHQPYFVDALKPEEVWILEKGEDGFAKIHHASDSPEIRHLTEEGLPLGGLWFSDYLDPR